MYQWLIIDYVHMYVLRNLTVSDNMAIRIKSTKPAYNTYTCEKLQMEGIYDMSVINYVDTTVKFGLLKLQPKGLSIYAKQVLFVHKEDLAAWVLGTSSSLTVRRAWKDRLG